MMAGCSHTTKSSSHTHGRTLCFECFRAGMERTRARREAWAQRSLPFDDGGQPSKPLSKRAIAHRQRMLDYLTTSARRRA
jgi:hypothetical protein